MIPGQLVQWTSSGRACRTCLKVIVDVTRKQSREIWVINAKLYVASADTSQVQITWV